MRNFPALAILMLLSPFALAAEQPAAPAVQVRFLDADAARKAIGEDMTEPYFSLLMPMEMAAKTGAPMPSSSLDEQRAECRRRYQAAVEEFTPEEQAAIRWYATEMSRLLDKDYPLLARTPWSFIKVSDDIEGAMAWTHGDSVVLPAHTVAGLVTAQSRARTRNVLVAGQQLVHEQVHVVQRANPGIFDGLYEKRWGFVHPDRIEPSAYLTEHQILNPDAPDLRWVFPIKDGDATRYIWPRVVFRETAGPPRFPQDMDAVAVHVEPAGPAGSVRAEDASQTPSPSAAAQAPTGASATPSRPAEGVFRVVTGQDGSPVMEDLASVKEYAAALAPSTYTIHPNEASADIFCGLLVFDDFIPHSRLPAGYVADTEKLLAPYRAYFRERLKERAGEGD